MGWKFTRIRSGRDARSCPTVTYRSIVKCRFISGQLMLKFIWVQSNRIPYSGDVFMFGPGFKFIHFMQPSYVQKSAEIYLANLTNLALMPNFPFRILPLNKCSLNGVQVLMQHYTVTPLFLQVDSLKSPTTCGSHHGHL